MILGPVDFSIHLMLKAVKNALADREKAPKTAFILGIVGLLTSFSVPLCTLPIPILGLIVSIAGRNSSQRKLAIAAGSLCVLSLILNALVVFIVWRLVFAGQ